MRNSGQALRWDSLWLKMEIRAALNMNGQIPALRARLKKTPTELKLLHAELLSACTLSSFRDVTAFQALFSLLQYWLASVSEPKRLDTVEVAGNFFPAPGVTPVLGSNFTGEESVKGGWPAVMLSRLVPVVNSLLFLETMRLESRWQLKIGAKVWEPARGSQTSQKGGGGVYSSPPPRVTISCSRGSRRAGLLHRQLDVEGMTHGAGRSHHLQRRGARNGFIVRR